MSPAELRRFGLATGAIFAGLFGLLLPWLFGRALPWWPWAIAAAFWLPALIAPILLRPVYRGWMIAGGALGWVNTRIILGVVFVVVVVPIGLVMRLFRKDPLARRFDRSLPSYRVPSVPRPRDHFERPF